MAIPANRIPGVQPPDVSVVDNVVFVDQYRTSNPRVVEVVGTADNAVAAVDNLLDIGAQALLAAGINIDTAVVERRFDGMTEQFDHRITEAVDQISEVTQQLLDEDNGAIPKVLGNVAAEITTILTDTFDEQRTTSALAKINRIVTEAQGALARAVRQELDPHADDSYMGRAVKQLETVVKDQTGVVLARMRDIELHVAKSDGKAEVINLTTGKGFDFEDDVHTVIGQNAALHGDRCDHTGKTTGAAGTQKGDSLVTVNPDDTMGIAVRFVVEAKDKKMTMPKALEELEQGMANHNAAAGIIVFASQDEAPTTVPFHPMGERAIAVFDKDDPNPQVLQLAFMWARWVARRTLAAAGDTFDLPKIEAAITNAQKALSAHQSLKACHSLAKKKIDEAGDHAARIVADVDSALKTLKEELS